MEDGLHFDHVWRFADRGDGYMEEIHGLREKYDADVAVLMVDDSSGCGLATRVHADADEAFAVVHHDCAIMSYSVAHEIGHLIGARHELKMDNLITPFPYGHGYVNGTKWRDIMSYKESCGGCPRIPVWSSPTVMVRGERAGSAVEDNARVIAEQAARVANFRMSRRKQLLSATHSSAKPPTGVADRSRRSQWPTVDVNYTIGDRVQLDRAAGRKPREIEFDFALDLPARPADHGGAKTGVEAELLPARVADEVEDRQALLALILRRSPRPSCWRNTVALSVGRRKSTVSTSGTSTPSLNRSTVKSTRSSPRLKCLERSSSLALLFRSPRRRPPRAAQAGRIENGSP